MTVAAVDISNLQLHPDVWPSQPWYSVYQAARLVIVQAIVVPRGYPGYDFIDPETGLAGYTGVQLRQALADGKELEAYAWLWHGLADTKADIHRRLSTIPPSVYGALRRIWIDAEDTTAQVGIAQSQVYHLEPTPERLERQLQCEARPM